MSTRPLSVLTGLTVALAVGEFISAGIIAVESYPDAQPVFGVVLGVVFLGAAWLLRSGRVVAGVVLVGVLCLFELAAFPGWQRFNALDWVTQLVYAALALAGLAASAWVFVARRSPSATAA